ncbi:dihydrodipicolinate synthase family protein [Actinoalloteichus hymeniacidonis]|uniref:Dihydrodipicolinate synthase/N-acetylneuraminate lyase n=1 Tax=Actinoalloteichus hymeniacidonis TaxID=340345 RepID=A0AAC9HQM4_9PSEU|nr:dihydrodipicolinate synthase family protein [Actinoalloteichus hymeniacidonis]AOS62780.1 dihydrodipicolinate synthase/N-acetylneuraminate lyase [Actinoalloteichus hymeniacidonis]MBB5909189.1 4-hydroxy-tetrahydrodipicolinate synthase [Actinoalloteichus hymeniacidonis]
MTDQHATPGRSPHAPLITGGVVPPLCTPLTPDRELDVDSLERLVAHLVTAGVHGLFVGGSTGEAAYLPDALRRQALDVVVGTVAGQLPVLAGVVDMSTPRVVEHARAAAALGADALVATAPFYSPTHPVEILGHFRTIRAAVDLPLIGYDIPSAVHTKLAAATVAELAADATLAGLKDSSGDLDGLRDVLELVAGIDGFRVFSGSETVADLGLRCGAAGVVPGLGNVDPHGYVRLYDAAVAGDWDEALRQQRRLHTLFDLIRVAPTDRMGRYSSAIGAFKAALMLRGVIRYPTTSLPMIPLEAAEIEAVGKHLAAADLPVSTQ